MYSYIDRINMRKLIYQKLNIHQITSACCCIYILLHNKWCHCENNIYIYINAYYLLIICYYIWFIILGGLLWRKLYREWEPFLCSMDGGCPRYKDHITSSDVLRCNASPVNLPFDCNDIEQQLSDQVLDVSIVIFHLLIYIY